MENLKNWLIEEWKQQAIAALAGMTGLAVSIDRVDSDSAPDSQASCWQAAFSLSPGARILLRSSQAACRSLGGAVLESAGMTDADDETIHSTYLEVAQQSASGVAQVIGRQLKQEVTCDVGMENANANGVLFETVSIGVEGRDAVRIEVGFSVELFAALDPKPQPVMPTAPALPEPAKPPSRTMGLLMEVDLPVAVSFGRAQMRLKDVIKLTTGSIVELNRTISEPVEIIINNCVIARGEVVVVEGNYGVRIQQIVSQQERLRTLF